MALRRSLRSQLYRAAPDLGNVEASSKGPMAYSRRLGRRAAWCKTNGGLRKVLQIFGM